ncbi:MAG: pyrroloquinoline quinone biosynthesis peptide chaperone PqqD [Gemmatimonadaceae bacterium]|nr:pyrroloquinoline quinone biosynthesis peptide chaperone PqqD [Gemmatimonadaceae bacterium]
MALTSSSRPKLWKFARVQFDDARQRSVLQYPEGAVLLNDTAAEILALCDGERTIEEIAATLNQRYDADVLADVLADVQTYLSELADRELVRDEMPSSPVG